MATHLRNRLTGRLSVLGGEMIGCHLCREDSGRNSPHTGHRDVVEVEIEMRRLIAVWIEVGRIGPMAMLVGLNLRMVEVSGFLNDWRKVQHSNGAGGARAGSWHVFDHG